MRPEERQIDGGPPASSPFFGLLCCFFLSGFAALLYQTVWTRQLAFVFGTAELAVAAVLAAYMAGLASGAAAATRFAARIHRPIAAYAALELVIAGAALLVPFAIGGVMDVAAALFGGGDALSVTSGAALASFRLLAAFAVLFVPTFSMGATLPILARVAVTTDEELGSKVGRLYAWNTAGAVCGTLVAAFQLFPRLGLAATTLVGVAVNAVVCGLAAIVARTATTAPLPPPPTRVESATPEGRIVVVVMLLSGVASFTYEVVWTRLLGHLLGGSVYAFATMLATFLGGIALGAGVGARLATTAGRALRGLAVAELAVAAAAAAAFRGMDALPALAVRVGAGKDPTAPGNVAIAALVMLPTTLAIGATFPLAVRAVARGRDDAAAASARVYAWNTMGAIVGALGAGFLAMPLLGYAGVVGAAVALNLILAFVLAVGTGRRAPVVAGLALAGLGCVALFPPATPWALVTTSPLSIGRETKPPEFFAVGRSAGVAVGREGGVLKLRTNGLPEGVMLPPRRYRKAIPDRWLGALPFLARPEAREALVVGLGAGTALEAMPRTLAEVDVVELEPRVIEANQRFRRERAVDALALPGLHLHVDDARGALNLTRKRYDVIVSQPSHPWTAGASHLYTREFFRTVRDHLVPDGVFVQWIDLDLVDRELLASLLATLLDAFDDVRVYRPFFRGTALFAASNAPLAIETHAPLALAAARDDLARAGILTREDVAAAFALDAAGARAIAAGAPLTTDDRNLLEMRSIRVTAPLGYRGTDDLFAEHDPLPAHMAELDRVRLVRRLLADWDFTRAGRVVQALDDPIERATATGIVALATERDDDGITSLRAALAADPRAYEARVALLRAERRRRGAGSAEVATLAAGLDDPARAVVEGWRLEDGRDWQALRGLESRLADARPDDAIYDDALRLRAAWRTAIGGEADGTEALSLLALALPTSVDPGDYLRRARAVLVAGDPGTAIESLGQALDSATPGRLRVVAEEASAILRAIGADDGDQEGRPQLERRLAVLRR